MSVEIKALTDEEVREWFRDADARGIEVAALRGDVSDWDEYRDFKSQIPSE